MFRAQDNCVRCLKRFKLLRTRSFCSSATKDSSKNPTSTRNNNNDISVNVESNGSHYNETYRQLNNLDMMTAAKILFNEPPKKKKFGLDFHLVQLFFACLPSLAVYLVAQYARYEMKKMEVEVEQKRKQMEEESKDKEKEMELNPPEGKAVESDPQLLEVKVRLEKLEEAMKEIVVETKKQSGSRLPKKLVNDDETKHLKTSAPSDMNVDPISNKTVEKHHHPKENSVKPKPDLAHDSESGSVAAPDAFDQKSQN